MKETYAIITPDPSDTYSYLVVPIGMLSEAFTEDDENQTYKVKIVRRTEKWFDKFPSI